MVISQIDRMIEHCREQQIKQNNPAATVVFKIPRASRFKRVRLFALRGPMGDVVQTADGTVTAKFKADAVIEFLSGEKSRELSRQIGVAADALKNKDK